MDLIETQLQNPMKHWYYKYKYSFIKKLIVKYSNNFKVLVDIGAGSAVFSRQLFKDFPHVSITAVDIGYGTEQLDDSSHGVKYLKELRNSDADIYILTDVLEHILDDSSFLQNYAGMAKNDSLFIITVPAMQSLWSGHDLFLKHYRRYSLENLKQLITTSNLHLLEIRYLYSLLFPIAWIRRRFIIKSDKKSELREFGFCINMSIRTLLFLDAHLFRKLNFGISLIAVAKKI